LGDRSNPTLPDWKAGTQQSIDFRRWYCQAHNFRESDMKKYFTMGGLFLALLAFYSPAEMARADRERERVFIIDVACDARTYTQNNVDPAASGSHRGDTFIVQGRIYPGGTIPAGEGVFSPDNPGSTGAWICRGVWMVDSDQLAIGTSPAFDTAQTYLLPDESRQLFSEGLEGPRPTLRAITGGTGSMKGVSGEVRQELLGTNVTGLFNFRFTFRLQKQDNDR
jgi:hypothetical protein